MPAPALQAATPLQVMPAPTPASTQTAAPAGQVMLPTAAAPGAMQGGQSGSAQVFGGDPTLLEAAAHDAVLSAGDLIAVRIFGVPDFAPPVRIGADGAVQLPLIGLVQVAGLTVNRAADLIAERLVSAGMFTNPQVTVLLSESASAFATVSGEIHAIVPVSGERRLLDVLAAAGNLPMTASRTITILRPGQKDPIIVTLGPDPAQSAAANIRIFPRDTILVGRAGVVYIVGAFKLQGAIPLQQGTPLTLMQATALSGGAGFEGDFKDLRIVRTVGNDRRLVTVNIKRVMQGTAPDPILQADDIVFLPTNALRGAIKSGGIATITGIASLLVIAVKR